MFAVYSKGLIPSRVATTQVELPISLVREHASIRISFGEHLYLSSFFAINPYIFWHNFLG